MKVLFFCIMVVLLTVSVAQGQTTHKSPDFYVQTGVRLIDTVYATCASSQTECLIAMAEYAQKHEYPDATTAQLSKNYTLHFIRLTYACMQDKVSKNECKDRFIGSPHKY